jgi:DNA-binding NtrC family response regulator
LETLPMNDVAALLVSRCPFVIEQVKGVALGVPGVQIDACSAQAAASRAQQPGVGLILAHLESNESAGIARLICSVAQAGRPHPTILLCDRHDEQQVAILLRAGAADYVVLPAESNRLGFLLGALTLRLRTGGSGAGGGRAEAPGGADEDGLGRLLGQVRRVAPQDTTVLLTGETGAGKTRLARLIHELSLRRTEPFLVVDCGSLSPALIESELFGHAKGAFTGADRDRAGKLAAAAEGTLLLDEINSLPLPLQSKLLRAIDERVYEPVGSEKSQPVRARFLAASNVTLEQEVQAGRFRADLFYRLNVVNFHLPALRERREGILSLARRFLEEFASRNRPDVTGFTPAVCAALEGYDWPGNVRELRNVVERAVALSPGSLVGRDDLPMPIRQAAASLSQTPPADTGQAIGPAHTRQDSPPLTLSESKDLAEIRRVKEALRKHNNKRAGAARELGISRVGLYKKLQKYGLTSPNGNQEEGGAGLEKQKGL